MWTSLGPVGLIQNLTGIGRQSIEADEKFRRLRIPGDLVLRKDAPIERILARFESILQQQLDEPVSLSLQEVERPVVVVRGTYRLTPPEGRQRQRIEVYDRELSDPNRGGGGTGTFGRFLVAVGNKIGRIVVSEVADPPAQVQWHFNEPRAAYRQLDEALMLQRLAEQTGLTFESETRPERILRVERAQ